MSLFDSKTEDDVTVEKKPYKFISGNIDGFMNEIKTPKQQQNIDEDIPIDDVEEPQEDPNDDYKSLNVKKAVAGVAGSSLTLFTDSVIPILIALLLKDDPENHKATDSELKQIEAAFTDYTQLQGVNLPPWVVLLGTVLSIYGFKAYSGLKQKQMSDEIATLKAENEKLKAKNE